MSVPAARLLPVVRCRTIRRHAFSRFSKHYSLAIYQSEIVLFRVRRGYIPPEEAYHPAGVESLLASRCCSRPVRVPLGEIVELSFAHEGLGLLKLIVSGRIRTARRALDFRIYGFEAKHVVSVLEEILPGRVINNLETREGPVAPEADSPDRKRDFGAANEPPRYAKRLATLLRASAIPGLGLGVGVAVLARQGDFGIYVSSAALVFGVGWFLLSLKLAFHWGQTPALELLASDQRPPILYLRSFKDDGTNNLHPLSLVAEIFGLKNRHRGRPQDREIDRVGAKFLLPMAKIACFVMRVGKLYNYFWGTRHSTAEEQFSAYFRTRGPFIAIGRPGEKVVPGGAARLYVGLDEWQAKVMELLPRAQLVLLQPEETEGVWWEIMQAIRALPPEKTLFCLVNYADNQQRYEEFRLRFEDQTGITLPCMIGRHMFLYFTAGWRARLLEPRYYSEFLWPMLGQAVNFDATLRPFFAREEPPPFSAKDRRFRGYGVPALLLYTIFTVAVLLAVILATK
jgi:hypothetical protein